MSNTENVCQIWWCFIHNFRNYKIVIPLMMLILLFNLFQESHPTRPSEGITITDCLITGKLIDFKFLFCLVPKMIEVRKTDTSHQLTCISAIAFRDCLPWTRNAGVWNKTRRECYLSKWASFLVCLNMLVFGDYCKSNIPMFICRYEYA